MNKKIIRISDIREDLYDANLDTEYREALAHAMIQLEYVSDTPLNLYFGTEKEKKELERVENMSLDSNQISEIIHLMMYEMRNDFQYGRFKPVANKYINISKQMEKKKDNSVNKEIQKPMCNIYGLVVIPEILGFVSKTLKENNMFDESKEMIERATLHIVMMKPINIIKEYVDIVKNEKKRKNSNKLAISWGS